MIKNMSRMGLLLSFLFSFCYLLTLTNAEFDESFIENFVVDSISKVNNAQCRDKLFGSLQMFAKINFTEQVEKRKQWYLSSFANGTYDDFFYQNPDRWIHRFLCCINSAGETFSAASPTRMRFCYGTDQQEKETISLCYTAECAQSDSVLMENWQNFTRHSQQYEKVQKITCTDSRYEKQWYQLPIPLVDLTIALALMLLVIFSTWRHIKSNFNERLPNGLKEKIILSFSAKVNCRKLFSMPRDPQSTITCLLGLRFLTMFWVLTGHSHVFYQAFIDNDEEYKTDMIKFYNLWISNFTLSVDVFLVISGTLTAYSWFYKWENKEKADYPGWSSFSYWLKYYRHRFIRLWPAYAYCVLLVTTRLSVSHHHASWPISDPAIHCNHHWWRNILFLNAFEPNPCLPYLWYIATEFLLYLISPVFLLILAKNNQAGSVFCVTIIGLSAGLNAVLNLAHNYPPTQMLFLRPSIFNQDFVGQYIDVYTKFYCRIGPYVIGILLGYMLATESKSPQNGSTGQKLTRTWQIFCWIGALLCALFGLFGIYPALHNVPMQAYHLFFGAVHRTVFSLSTAWLIYACHSGLGGYVNSVLGHGFFVPLSNLCYGCYLFHMVTVPATFLWSDFPMHYSGHFSILLHCCLQLLLAYICAFVVSQIVEFPALNLEKYLLGEKRGAEVKLEQVSAEAKLARLPTDMT